MSALLFRYAFVLICALSFSQLKKPSLNGPKGPLFFQAPLSLRQATQDNLQKTLAQLGLADGDEIAVTDANLPFQLSLLIKYDV